MVFRCINTPGGRLSGITYTGQQLYEAVDIPYGLKPSVSIAILTFRASSAHRGYLSSKFFHALPSDGCPIFFRPCPSSYIFPFLCHVICLSVSSLKYGSLLAQVKPLDS